jgi:hypothetical protein
MRSSLPAGVPIHPNRTSPIDQAAWERILPDYEPLFLKGDDDFGLLVPQLFEQLNSGLGAL